jgi:hypothetical protein
MPHRAIGEPRSGGSCAPRLPAAHGTRLRPQDGHGMSPRFGASHQERSTCPTTLLIWAADRTSVTDAVAGIEIELPAT